MKADAPNGVTGDASRDGVGSPSREFAQLLAKLPEDHSFFTDEYPVPPAHGVAETRVRIHHTGDGTFNISIGTEFAATFELWTDYRGLRAIEDACHEARERAAK